MELNNRQRVALLLGGTGLFFAVKYEECRLPYVERVLPAALMACGQTKDTKPPSDSQKKLKGKGKPSDSEEKLKGKGKK